MSTYRLDQLFAPRSVAVVGASPREGSVGRAVLRNLLAAGFQGSLTLVNPRHREMEGLAAAASIDTVRPAPDVAVIAAPPDQVPRIIAAAAGNGVAAAVILTAGLGHGTGSLAEVAERAAREKGLRIVGPNCLGVMAPAANFNASFATRMPRRGDLALVSQSGAIVAGMAEWAAQRAIGFSAVVSLGDQLDVDFGDLLDFFALDPSTRAILLYVESIKNARKFMSAARAAARTKPVVVVKSGRHAQAAKAAATHTGALAGSDAVYDAAFRRAGLLRVSDLDELFDAVETLARLRPFTGNRLAVLTNGGGIGVLAIDRLVDLGGTVAELSPQARARLDAALPLTWSKANPVDIIGDADAERYAAALEALIEDRENDAILVLNVPTALASAADTAARVAGQVKSYRAKSVRPKPVFAVWIGADRTALDAFEAAEIPHFDTESDAIRGFMDLARYAEAREDLMATPPSLPEHFAPDAETARSVIEAALADGRAWLDPIEIGRLFAAYAIPIVPAVLAESAEQAAAAAKPFLAAGQTVVVKIQSRDIVHKSDIGGVRLNLTGADDVRAAAAQMLGKTRAARPDARIAGVIVQPMILRPKARELIAGIADDPTFGPVIVFGYGGTAVEVIDDKALALPPLDLKLAGDLIARTRVARLLKAYRDVPAASETEVALVLVKLAQLAADLPEIRALDINPLLADETGVLALDARVAIARVAPGFKGSGNPRFAVRPYPKEWERRVALADGRRVFVRPLRPEDEPMVRAFFGKVTAEDLRLRFFAPVKDFSHAFIARLTQLDYGRAMAFAAVDEASGELLGVVRIHADANYECGEYAILLRSDLKGHGLGWELMQLIIGYARSEGLRRIEGQVLRENSVMLQMCRELGFRVEADPEARDTCIATLPLNDANHFK
jgi:acetyltransferase